MHSLSFVGFLMRWLVAVLLVLGTFNPTSFCYLSWVLSSSGNLPLKALVGIMLVAVYAVYYHATRISIGKFGVVLVLLLFGTVIWQLADWGWLDPANPSVMGWLGLFILATIMTIGMSWSHIQRRLSGQFDMELDV